jgi:hypothetical protein
VIRPTVLCKHDTTRLQGAIPSRWLTNPALPNKENLLLCRFQLDFVIGFPSSLGCDTILTVVHCFTNMVALIQTTTECDANECARLLLAYVFSKHGVLADLVRDRDTRFTSHY